MNLITPFLRGGLGNYLFQISAAYAISKRDNKKLAINISDISEIHSPISIYFNNIFRKLEFVNGFDNFVSHSPMQPIQFSQIPNTPSNLKLEGYYQNEKYFIDLRDEILELFSVDEITKTEIESKYSSLFNNPTCSIHVRRGNYLQKSDFHPPQNLNYYKSATNLIGDNHKFIIFSDDIEWCKDNFDFLPEKEFISGNTDYFDLYLMSMCDNHIIANSSFSWWGAWLNKNKNKKVIYPSVWFGVPFLDTSEIGCNGWIKL
jgi:hypothetical protein